MGEKRVVEGEGVGKLVRPAPLQLAVGHPAPPARLTGPCSTAYAQAPASSHPTQGKRVVGGGAPRGKTPAAQPKEGVPALGEVGSVLSQSCPLLTQSGMFPGQKGLGPAWKEPGCTSFEAAFCVCASWGSRPVG